MDKREKQKLITILEEYTDRLFDKYYVVNNPLVKNTNRITERGYGRNKNKETDSINFVFNTTKPSEDEMYSFCKQFVDEWSMKHN